MKTLVLSFTVLSILVFASTAIGQSVTRELKFDNGRTITIVNLTGRVDVLARPGATTVSVSASSTEAVGENEVRIDEGGNLKIETAPAVGNKRIDLSLVVPERVRIKIETREGGVRVSGDIESVDARTDTGTIAADVPTVELKYDFFWTESRPRYLSDIELEPVKEKSGGKFQLKGTIYGGVDEKMRDDAEDEESGDAESKE